MKKNLYRYIFTMLFILFSNQKIYCAQEINEIVSNYCKKNMADVELAIGPGILNNQLGMAYTKEPIEGGYKISPISFCSLNQFDSIMRIPELLKYKNKNLLEWYEIDPFDIKISQDKKIIF